MQRSCNEVNCIALAKSDEGLASISEGVASGFCKQFNTATPPLLLKERWPLLIVLVLKRKEGVSSGKTRRAC